MGTKKSLDKAHREQDGEYYTLYEDIAAELPRYKEQLRGMRIICPCDWDESYNEELVYKEEGVMASDLFSEGSIKHLDLVGSKKKIEKDFNLLKCNFVKFLVAHAEAYGIRSISVSGYAPLTGRGVRFQDVDYSLYDVVITNPPYSLFGEFIDTMISAQKKFLVIGPLTGLTYKKPLEYVQTGRLWLGYAKQLKGFERPDGTLLLSKNQDGSVARASKWYTNLDVAYRHDRLILTKSYKENPEEYPRYLNYNAIHVARCENIPYDYKGVMGVPTSFMSKYNPSQFEIVGSSTSIKSDKNLKTGSGAAYLELNGMLKRKFTRLFIRNLQPITEENAL